MDNAETRLHTPQGTFELRRLPHNPLLRAWDAADERLLQHVHEAQLLHHDSRILIINDSFGALAVALHNYAPTAMSDSWLSQQATRLNYQANRLDPAQTPLLTSLDNPQGRWDLVLIKIPKTLALLEDELIRIRPYLQPHSTVIAAGMIKALPASAWQLMEKYIGPTQPSQARKKARLIFARVDDATRGQTSPYPRCYPLENTDYQLCNHANVFSRDSLDIGTRFFLQHLPRLPHAETIADLGCGNGVLGLVASEKMPQAVLHFVDESFMALASANMNFRRAFPERRAEFHAGDGLRDFADHCLDLILCNPPFHQSHVVGDHIAQAMFDQAKRCLQRGGELWVVGNRHLGYHLSLKKRFGKVETVASNTKFVILRAVKA